MSLRAAALGGGGTTGGGVAPFPGYISGNWYAPYLSASSTSGNTNNNTNLTLGLEYFPQAVTISEVGCRIVSTSAGGLAMVGIYAHNAATGKPSGNALISVTGLSTTAAGTVTAVLGAPVTLAAGFYWMAGEMDNAVATFAAVPFSGYSLASVVGTTAAAFSPGDVARGWGIANTYGTFPDLTAGAAGLTSVNGDKAPVIVFRVA